MIELYVSPHGNDDWRGAAADPTTDGNDGPLRTLAAAQRAVRRIKATLASPEEIRVNLRGGMYELDETWRFHAEDAGFGREINRKAKTWPVTWAAYGDETPVISGGRRIAGPWGTGNDQRQHRLHHHAARRAARARLHTALGQRRTPPPPAPAQAGRVAGRARLPRARLSKGRAQPISDACVYREGQLSADWHNLHDVELHFFGWWIDRMGQGPRDRRGDPAPCAFDRTAKLRMEWGKGDGVDYVVENVFEALTEPGEWYLDRYARASCTTCRCPARTSTLRGRRGRAAAAARDRRRRHGRRG